MNGILFWEYISFSSYSFYLQIKFLNAIASDVGVRQRRLKAADERIPSRWSIIQIVGEKFFSHALQEIEQNQM